MRREMSAVSEAKGLFPPVSSIDTVIIIDRSVDMITPICTQLTYEGLVDEIFGIQTSACSFLSLFFKSRG